jgi:hypothetical protein
MKVKCIGLKNVHILHILHIYHSVSAMDGDQLVDFYWIDPMVTVERIAAKSQYAGHLYLQFELEESWDIFNIVCQDISSWSARI